MSIVVPPAPSHESASAVMARLARLSQGGPSEEKGEQPARRPRMLLVMSCLLCACGIFLLICTLAVMCMPDTPLSQVVFLICETFS